MGFAAGKMQMQVARSSSIRWRVAFDNPQLNLIGPQFVGELRKIVTAIESDAEPKAVVSESAVVTIVESALREACVPPRLRA